MFKLFRNLKPMAILLVLIIILVTGQAVAELYLPQKMSEIIDNGIYLDYEPLYKSLSMKKPGILGEVDDGDSTISGYNSDTIPVFEMVDGFSTFDLADALSIVDPSADTRLLFVDIPVKDSEELFDNVMTPFMDGIKKYQKPKADFNSTDLVTGYTEQEKAEITSVINSLIYFDPIGDPFGHNGSITVAGDGIITVNDLLDKEEDGEDLMSNDSFRKILTACITKMKHSQYGNLMPIPLDKDGNRLATDENGTVIQAEKMVMVFKTEEIEAADGSTTSVEYYDKKDSETGRPVAMPDYELIICAKVLGYAYKYSGDKWVDRKLGITDTVASRDASLYNYNLIVRKLITENDFTAENGYSEDDVTALLRKIRKITDIDDPTSEYSEQLILLENLLNAGSSSEARIVKIIDKFYNGSVSKVDQFFIKLGNYLKLSPTGTAQKQEQKDNALRSAREMKLADGETIQTKDLNYILIRGGYMLLLTVLACGCAICAAFLSAKVASNFSATIRSQVFSKVESFSLNEIDKFSTASLITRSTNDINQIQTVFLLVLRTALIAPIIIIGGFILSGQKSVPMTLTIFYPFPILIVASVVAAKIVFPLFTVIQDKVDRLTLIMREGLTGIRVVRAFNQQARERARFQKVNDSLTKTAIKVNKYCAVLAPLISVVMNCTMVGIVWVASSQIAYDGVYSMWGMTFNNQINVGDMMAVIQYITQIMMALVMLATVFVMFPRASASGKRVNEVLETKLTILDPQNTTPNYTSSGSLEFRNVNFKYADTADKYILTDISFHAQKGRVTAIVGGTGSGKSSIINLVPRFYDIKEGDILVDGISLKDIPQEELRKKIGFVPQRSVLFSGTIRSNLCYGKEDATEEELWEALRIAQSESFVREKDGGLDSKVEQGGNNFSGGQKQRLAIARAIIRRPEVLIFDDSFSALDFRTDKKLRTALKAITKESATIIIAQRIGTIMDADNIIVLNEGKIVAQGVHQDLIHNCELYRDIALSQMSEEELGL